ncbi:MAG: AhpC/TSA family protein [Prevotella sp.]|nr:AhpC/TSA family protein [Prevotella sp.]
MTKHITYLILLTLVLVSCGVDGKHFKLEGRFLHLNQGEFYVYSTDGVLDGIDTIKIEGGRFAYEIPCEEEGTLVMVFPNFSEQPVFTQPGKTVEIKADASHLKELEAEGTDNNKLMTAFRKQISNMSPQQTIAAAAEFVKHNPKSNVSAWLIRKYFLLAPTPDYAKAKQLIDLMIAEQPKNGKLVNLQQELKGLSATPTGKTLPTFTATDINGNKVTQASVAKSPMAVIFLWASWNYESTDMQTQLKRLKASKGNNLSVIGICIDPSKSEMQQSLRRDSISWPTINDGMMFDTKVAKLLGLSQVPSNILLKNGKIVGRNLRMNELKEKIEN